MFFVDEKRSLFLSCLYYFVSVMVNKTEHYPDTVPSEPPHDKTNKMICVPSEDTDQPGHRHSLIRVFTVRSMGSEVPKVSSCGQ